MTDCIKITGTYAPPGQPNVVITAEVGVLTDNLEFASLGKSFNPDGADMNTRNWLDADLKSAVQNYVSGTDAQGADIKPYLAFVVVGMNNVAL